MFVISFLVQCNPSFVGNHPPFADFDVPRAANHLTIKIEVQ